MTARCSENFCPKPSTIYCYDCKKNYCHEHYEKHDVQLSSLDIAIKTLLQQYEELDPDDLLPKYRRDLDEWRNEAHRTIDDVYTRKTHELEDRILRPGRRLTQAQNVTKEYLETNSGSHHDIEQLSKDLRDIQRDIQNLQKGLDLGLSAITSLQLTTKPSESESGESMGNLAGFQLPPTYRLFNCSNKSGVAIAANDESLLIYEDNHLLLLNQELVVIDRLQWPFGQIFHLTWLPRIFHYLAITEKGTIHVINKQGLNLHQRIETIPEEKWWCATASEEKLFVSTSGTDPAVVQFDLPSKFRIVQRYKSPYFCRQDEMIHQIHAIKQALLLLISHSTRRETHCDLKSLNGSQLYWRVPLENLDRSFQTTMRACLLPSFEFIIVYENHTELIHLDRDGQKQQTQHRRPVWNAVLFNKNKLVIRTDRNLFVYQLE